MNAAALLDLRAGLPEAADGPKLLCCSRILSEAAGSMLLLDLTPLLR